jgi:sentrin-specific protease 1
MPPSAPEIIDLTNDSDDKTVGEAEFTKVVVKEEPVKIIDSQQVEEPITEAESHEIAAELITQISRPIKPKDQEILDMALYQQGQETEVLARIGKDSVTISSMRKLRPKTWLGDKVIHAFFNLLALRDEALCKANPNRKRNHFFKSFFFTKMMNVGSGFADLHGKYCYRNVNRWSKKVPGKDIFNLDKMFIPINVRDRSHWIVAVIDMTKKKITIFDSYHYKYDNVLKALFQYVQDEHLARKGVPLPDLDEWELLNTPEGMHS